MVFIQINLNLLLRKIPQYYEDPIQKWDIGEDDFDSTDDAGMLEIVQFSLNEAKMKVVVFTDNRGVGGEGGNTSE